MEKIPYRTTTFKDKAEKMMGIQEVENNMEAMVEKVIKNKQEAEGKEVEAKKWEFEKFEQIVNQPLYISLGIFAIFPTLYILLRTPYTQRWLLWGIAITGGTALIMGAIVKHFVASYSEKISLWIKNAKNKPELDFGDLLKGILQIAFYSAIIQFIFFVLFVAFNIPHSFNEPPRIESLKVSQSVVKPGESVSIQAVVVDRDQDINTYEWNNKIAGEISDEKIGEITDANDSTVTWVAPKTVKSGEQKVDISVKVRDSQDNETVEKTTIIVRESPEIKAMIQKICIMAKPLEMAVASTVKRASFKKYVSRPSFSPVKIQMIQPSNPPQLRSGAACEEKIREVVDSVETEAEKKVVGEAIQEEIKTGVDAVKSPDKSRLRRWRDELCKYNSILTFFLRCPETAK
jgi:hypothetical protein